MFTGSICQPLERTVSDEGNLSPLVPYYVLLPYSIIYYDALHCSTVDEYLVDSGLSKIRLKSPTPADPRRLLAPGAQGPSLSLKSKITLKDTLKGALKGTLKGTP